MGPDFRRDDGRMFCGQPSGVVVAVARRGPMLAHLPFPTRCDLDAFLSAYSVARLRRARTALRRPPPPPPPPPNAGPKAGAARRTRRAGEATLPRIHARQWPPRDRFDR